MYLVPTIRSFLKGGLGGCVIKHIEMSFDVKFYKTKFSSRFDQILIQKQKNF